MGRALKFLGAANRRTLTVSLAMSLLPIVSLPATASVQSQKTLRLCQPGVTLGLDAGPLQQGRIRVLEVRSSETLSDLRAAWAGESLHFWRVEDNYFRALMGFDLELTKPPATLALSGLRQSGEPVVCTWSLPLVEGEFRVVTERLRVSSRFVQPSEKDMERARAEAERLQAIWESVTPERLWTGPFLPPLKRMQPRGNFGRRRVFNGRERAPHTGEDLRASLGTRVYASQRGKVVLAAKLFYAGNTVILEHGLGLFTYYAHLSRIDVREGQMVEPRQLLGRAGATGRVTAAHLHWAARIGNARVNPMELLDLPLGPTEPRGDGNNRGPN